MLIIRKAVVACAVLTLATALSSPPAFARGGGPKASLTASSSCLLTATVSWRKLTVTQVNWTLDRDNVVAGGGFSSGFGALSSPQSISFQQTTSVAAHTFRVTAALFDSATQVGSASTNAVTVNCM